MEKSDLFRNRLIGERWIAILLTVLQSLIDWLKANKPVKKQIKFLIMITNETE